MLQNIISEMPTTCICQRKHSKKGGNTYYSILFAVTFDNYS